MTSVRDMLRALTLVLALTTITTLAACSGDDGVPAIASAGGAESASHIAAPTSATTDERADYVRAQLAWVACLRKQGVNPPDPDENGVVRWLSKDMAREDSASFEKAGQACKPLQTTMPKSLADALTPTISPDELRQARSYAECMRKNGASDFPDPGPAGFDEDRRWNQEAPAAIRAGRICAPVIGDPVPTGPGLG